MRNRRTKGLWIGLALTVLPSLACLTPREGRNVRITRAELAASLGAYAAEGEARVEHADDDYVELHAHGPSGAVMLGLSVDEGLESIPDGESASVDVLGCGGPYEGGWSFDRHARAAWIRVEPANEGRRRVFVRAEWSDGSTARATFEYELPEPGRDRPRTAQGRQVSPVSQFTWRSEARSPSSSTPKVIGKGGRRGPIDPGLKRTMPRSRPRKGTCE